jgi:GNAT superfamily N-acetyltransferase
MIAPESTEIVLVHLDPTAPDEGMMVALNAHMNRMREESRPDDPPRSLDHTRNTFASVALLDHIALEAWLARREGELVGTLMVNMSRKDNLHMAFLDISVAPEQRRQGIGSLLLRKGTEIAAANERGLLLFQTTSTVPAGAAFLERYGAAEGLAASTNQLLLADVDRTMLADWHGGEHRLGDFDLLVWEGAYPEENLEAMVHLNRVMNQQPFDDLDVEAFTVDAEQLRKLEQFQAARNQTRWTMVARHLPSGDLAGFTDVLFDPENPENLMQGNTGVDPTYRGNGLGKWLKAAMLTKLLAERSGVKRIRTGNADSNEAMLAINHRLGFERYVAESVWQLPMERLSEVQ